MKTYFLIRFALAAVFISTGCLLLLSELSGVGLCFGIAVLLFMPRSELTEAIPRREVWLTFGLLFSLIVVVAATKYLFSASVSDAVHTVIRHPGFIVPLWLVMLWGLFRHFKRQKRTVHA